MRQIIAMGGGGFSMEPENPLLDLYVLQQCGKPAPKVCFVPTASGDAEGYVERFYHAFRRLDCEPSHLSLFRPPTEDLAAFVLEKDVIYVGGGNTKNLLALWREWGLDRILRRAWEEGVVLAGLSAGAICWFEEGVTDSYGERLDRIAALGFLPGSFCPHYDGEAERRPAFHRLLEEGRIGPGWAADDGAALHFVDRELKAVVSSRPAARAYRLERVGGRAVETALETRYLG
ncbi:MAG: peptidase E [Firmicutes bacterium]|nr:peptidase E [Bacillota bacterium]